jgi:hypothetical protein
MRIQPGMYGEMLPSGEYAVLVPEVGIQTHQGLIPLPGGNVLFVRITNVGGFKIAGQGHQDGLAWEYANGVWASHGPTYGVSPLIYDNNGVLKFAAVEHGSQGFRYVTPDNRLVTGDQTYGHPTLKLWEYTDLDGILIGQGEGGCHVYIDGVLRQLEAGDTRFIRANRSGDRFAITVVHLDGLFTTLTSSLPCRPRRTPASACRCSRSSSCSGPRAGPSSPGGYALTSR